MPEYKHNIVLCYKKVQICMHLKVYQVNNVIFYKTFFSVNTCSLLHAEDLR